MKIINKTAWDTADLRRVFGAVLKAWNAGKPPARQVRSKRLKHVKVVYARSWWGFSGCAYLNSGWMTIRVPRPQGHGIKRCEQRFEVGTETDAEGKVWNYARPIPDSWHTVERKAVEALDVLKLAHLFEHELAHCAGYRHEQMGALNVWGSATAERYPYLAEITVRVAEPKAKPKVDRQAAAHKAALAGLARWQTKLKRAETGVRKYQKKVRYYEKALSSREA